MMHSFFARTEIMRARVKKIADSLLFGATLIFWILLGFVAIVLSSLFIDVFNLVGNTFISDLVRWITKTVASLGSEWHSNEELLARKKTILEFLVIVVTVFLALLGPLSYLSKIRSLARHQPIKSKPIYVAGDDLHEMARLYKEADEVYVFSGDFSWVSNNDQLRESVQTLAQAGKIKFFSYKSEAKVEHAFRDSGNLELFRELKPLFAFDSKAQIKGSLIRSQSPAFIYRNDELPLGEGGSTINILTGHDRARYLVTIIDELCEQVATMGFIQGDASEGGRRGFIVVGLLGAGK